MERQTRDRWESGRETNVETDERQRGRLETDRNADKIQMDQKRDRWRGR